MKKENTKVSKKQKSTESQFGFWSPTKSGKNSGIVVTKRPNSTKKK